MGDRNRRNNNNRNNNDSDSDDDVAANIASLAIGAGIVLGCAAYKLFGGSGGNEKETKPMPIRFRMNSLYSFPRDSKTYVINTIEECRYAIRELKSHCAEYGVLGFDCEWVPYSYRRNVALLQLASHRGLCVLIRLCALKRIPSELAEILTDPKILKVGIASNNDARYLNEDYSCRAKGVLDLRFVAKLARCDYTMGLARMSEQYLQVPIEKEQNIRCSDWEDEPLSEMQIFYASLDALIGIELFKYFGKKIARNNSIRMHQVIDECGEYADIVFRGN